MDIHRWLNETGRASLADGVQAAGIDDLSTRSSLLSSPQRRSISVDLEPRSVERKRAQHHSSKPRHPIAPAICSSNGSSSTSDVQSTVSSSTLSDEPPPSEHFEKRPRRKTRPDLFEPGSGARKRRNNTADRSKRKRAKRKTEKAKKQKPGHKLLKHFQAANVPGERLTLQPATSLGLFKNGRASGLTRGKGLRDLVFSEMSFLRKPANDEEDEPINSLDTRPKRKKDRAADEQEEIAAYFAAESLLRGRNHTSTSATEPRRSSQNRTRRSSNAPHPCLISDAEANAPIPTSIEYQLHQGLHARSATKRNLPSTLLQSQQQRPAIQPPLLGNSVDFGTDLRSSHHPRLKDTVQTKESATQTSQIGENRPPMVVAPRIRPSHDKKPALPQIPVNTRETPGNTTAEELDHQNSATTGQRATRVQGPLSYFPLTDLIQDCDAAAVTKTKESKHYNELLDDLDFIECPRHQTWIEPRDRWNHPPTQRFTENWHQDAFPLPADETYCGYYPGSSNHLSLPNQLLLGKDLEGELGQDDYLFEAEMYGIESYPKEEASYWDMEPGFEAFDTIGQNNRSADAASSTKPTIAPAGFWRPQRLY